MYRSLPLVPRFLLAAVFVCGVPAAALAEATVQIAVLGDARASKSDLAAKAEPAGVNAKVLGPLLRAIRARKPTAVLFTGDLVYGKDLRPGRARQGVEDDGEDGGDGRELVYSGEILRRQLDAFDRVLRSQLGDRIPFYPAMGNHEARGVDSLGIFRARFGLPPGPDRDETGLAYTVDIGGAHVAFVSTDGFDPRSGRRSKHRVPDSLLDWLERDLAAHSNSRYRFVVGHEPAFTAHRPEPKGLDKHPEARDRFWRILQAGGVSAYFCGHQHLYQSSYHDGVWQVITGGAGAPLSDYAPERFYHYVMLALPAAGAGPSVRVYDDAGRLRDSLRLRAPAGIPFQRQNSKANTAAPSSTR